MATPQLAYYCTYRHNNGRICARKAARPEGCTLHWDRPERRPCAKCLKPTRSKYGMCSACSRSAAGKAHYQRKKLNKAISEELESKRIMEELQRLLDSWEPSDSPTPTS